MRGVARSTYRAPMKNNLHALSLAGAFAHPTLLSSCATP